MQGELRNINILRIAREGDPEKEIRGEKKLPKGIYIPSINFSLTSVRFSREL